MNADKGYGVDIIYGIDSYDDCINVGSNNGVSLKSSNHGVVI